MSSSNRVEFLWFAIALLAAGIGYVFGRSSVDVITTDRYFVKEHQTAAGGTVYFVFDTSTGTAVRSYSRGPDTVGLRDNNL